MDSKEIQTQVVLFLLGIFCIVGTIGNSLVLYIYSKKKDKSTATIFILALAGTDFLTCLVIIPYNIVTLYLNYKLVYDAVCQVYMFLITCNVPFAAFIMVAIAFDRYFCICHPFLRVFTIFRAKIIIFILGVFSCSLGIMTALMYKISSATQTSADVLNSTCIELLSNNSEQVSTVTFLPKECNSTVMTEYNTTDSFYGTNGNALDNGNNYGGECSPGSNIFDADFIDIYSKFHSALYLLSFCIVVVLYALIYREIHVRRARKAKRKRSSLFPTTPGDISTAETQLTVLNGNGEGNIPQDTAIPPNTNRKSRKLGNALKEKQFYANIRTAAMLFVVTFVFLIAFLPAWLMAHLLITYNVIVFYMYFIYNVVNPVIYAFMNQSFRVELKSLISKICA